MLPLLACNENTSASQGVLVATSVLFGSRRYDRRIEFLAAFARGAIPLDTVLQVPKIIYEKCSELILYVLHLDAYYQSTCCATVFAVGMYKDVFHARRDDCG